MAYYNYKRVRDLLIECGWLDKYGNAVRDSDKREYKGEHDYDCHLWTMAAERIEQLEQEIASLKQQIDSANEQLNKALFMLPSSYREMVLSELDNKEK